MDKIVSNFRGFDGRLNRQAWWIGVVILVVVSFIISSVLGLILGTGNVAVIGADGSIDANAVASLTQKAGWQGLITNIILAYPYLALTIKRRHDRNNNGYDAIALIVLGLIYSLLTAVGIATMGGIVGGILGVILLVLAIWVLVQVGFLKGTAGPNGYGANPL